METLKLGIHCEISDDILNCDVVSPGAMVNSELVLQRFV